jgi:hypothetical protein
VNDLRGCRLERPAHFLELDKRVHARVEQHVGAGNGRMRQRVGARERRMVAMNRGGLRRAAVFEQERRLQPLGERGQRGLRAGYERDLAAGDDRDGLAAGEQLRRGRDIGRIGSSPGGKALTLFLGERRADGRFHQILRQTEKRRTRRLGDGRLQRAGQIARDAFGPQRDARALDELPDEILLER